MSMRNWFKKAFGRGREAGGGASATLDALSRSTRSVGINPGDAVRWQLPDPRRQTRSPGAEGRLLEAESFGLHGAPQEGLDLLSSDPPTPTSLMVRSWLNFLLGSWHQARHSARSAVKELPWGEMRCLAALRCSWIHLYSWELGVVEECLALLRTEASSDPWRTLARLAECSLLQLQGHRDRALQGFAQPQSDALASHEPALLYWLTVARNDLGFPQAALELACSTLEQGNIPAAGKALLWLQAARACAVLDRSEDSAVCNEFVMHNWPGIWLLKQKDRKSGPVPVEEELLLGLRS